MCVCACVVVVGVQFSIRRLPLKPVIHPVALMQVTSASYRKQPLLSFCCNEKDAQALSSEQIFEHSAKDIPRPVDE